MSLKVKDRFFSALLGAASAYAVYVQYFAPIQIRQQVPYVWGLVLVVVFLFLRMSQPGQDFITYVKQARAELRKVVWPQSSEVMSATTAVGIAVAIFSILVSLLDSMLSGLLAKIIG